MKILYKVALFKAATGVYFTMAEDSEPEFEGLIMSEQDGFIKYITDWIEYEAG